MQNIISWGRSTVLQHSLGIGYMEDWNVDDNAKKEFDVVQELFSQVVQ